MPLPILDSVWKTQGSEYPQSDCDLVAHVGRSKQGPALRTQNTLRSCYAPWLGGLMVPSRLAGSHQSMEIFLVLLIISSLRWTPKNMPEPYLLVRQLPMLWSDLCSLRTPDSWMLWDEGCCPWWGVGVVCQSLFFPHTDPCRLGPFCGAFDVLVWCLLVFTTQSQVSSLGWKGDGQVLIRVGSTATALLCDVRRFHIAMAVWKMWTSHLGR